MPPLFVATQNVWHRLRWARTHGRPSFRANGVWLQVSVPTVFGCVVKIYAPLSLPPACPVCAWRPKTSVIASYRHGRMADHRSARMVYGCRYAFQQSSGVLKRLTRCSSRPVHAHFVRGDPKRLSSPHIGTDAWPTIVPREWCMVAGKRSNNLRVCCKDLGAAQLAPCMPTLCVATQNVCHRLI